MDPVLGTATAGKLKVCMSFGNGSIIDSVSSGTANTALNGLNSVIGTMGTFNATTLET